MRQRRFAGAAARCGPLRTVLATTAANCGIRAILPTRNGRWSSRRLSRAKRGGNKRTVDVREVINGLTYVLRTGCQWRAIPKDLPPRSTVNHYFCNAYLNRVEGPP